MRNDPTDAEQAAIRAEIERLRLEHHDLEAAVGALLAASRS